MLQKKVWQVLKRVLKILVLIGVFFTAYYFYYNNQFWTHVNTDNFKVLREYNGRNIKGYRGRQVLVHKDFEKYIQQIDSYANANNLELVINQSYRSDKKSPVKTVVKPAKYSNHHAGFAIDFNVKYDGEIYFSDQLKRGNISKLPSDIQNFFQKIRQDQNLRWGGDFNTEDPIHIDMPINLLDKTLYLECSSDCESDYLTSKPKWEFWN